MIFTLEMMHIYRSKGMVGRGERERSQPSKFGPKTLFGSSDIASSIGMIFGSLINLDRRAPLPDWLEKAPSKY